LEKEFLFFLVNDVNYCLLCYHYQYYTYFVMSKFNAVLLIKNLKLYNRINQIIIQNDDLYKTFQYK